MLFQWRGAVMRICSYKDFCPVGAWIIQNLPQLHPPAPPSSMQTCKCILSLFPWFLCTMMYPHKFKGCFAVGLSISLKRIVLLHSGLKTYIGKWTWPCAMCWLYTLRSKHLSARSEMTAHRPGVVDEHRAWWRPTEHRASHWFQRWAATRCLSSDACSSCDATSTSTVLFFFNFTKQKSHTNSKYWLKYQHNRLH